MTDHDAKVREAVDTGKAGGVRDKLFAFAMELGASHPRYITLLNACLILESIAAARAQGAAEEREKSRAAALAVSETHPNIGPALTVEQWRAFLRLPRPVIRILPHPDVQDYEIHDAARHEVAAVALYGQPFGFTHDDIQHLHWAANLQDRLGVRDAGWTANNLRSLADRIAALLPPTDEAPMPNPTPDGAA